jgi:hypothetical protein
MRPRKEPNYVSHLPEGVSVITLECRNGETFACRMDTADYETVKKHRWSVAKREENIFYAQTHVAGNKPLLMHMLLLGCNSGVDHKDGNGLNNVRGNLRAAVQRLNGRNRAKSEERAGKVLTSRYKGVSWHNIAGKWACNIRIDGRRIYLGLFDDEDRAGRCYDEAARLHCGKFSRTNFQEVSEKMSAN